MNTKGKRRERTNKKKFKKGAIAELGINKNILLQRFTRLCGKKK